MNSKIINPLKIPIHQENSVVFFLQMPLILQVHLSSQLDSAQDSDHNLELKEDPYSTLYKASVLHLTTVHEKTHGIDIFFPISLNSIKEKFNKIKSHQLSQKATYTKWMLKI